ncbi:MAG: roadblock/LC7 domain-containing protein [Gemmatimonadaceae bacterium]
MIRAGVVVSISLGNHNRKIILHTPSVVRNSESLNLPTIRDLVSTVRQREGVAAAVVLGRDGLLIDGQGAAGIDTEGLAAMVPAVLTASEELGEQAGGKSLATCVLEYAGRIIIICSLTSDAILLVVASE